jgi:hypothetical protein
MLVIVVGLGLQADLLLFVFMSVADAIIDPCA